jgi:hypothetical protein
MYKMVAEEKLSRTLEELKKLVQTPGNDSQAKANTLAENLIDEAEVLLGETGSGEAGSITVGDIAGSTAVAIGSDIRIVVEQTTFPDELASRLMTIAERIEQGARSALVTGAHIRVFLSSPGDVGDERNLALRVIEKLPYDPLLRGKVTIEAVAWDKADASAPMLATMSPQEAINQGLAKPSDCDIVVVILWSRMGTPLPESYVKPEAYQFSTSTHWAESRYYSGTEWEYIDAMQAAEQAGRPYVLVYRRTDPPVIAMTDPDFDSKREQWNLVEAFFATFTNPDGSIPQGYNTYESPSNFEKQFELHLRALIARIMIEMDTGDAAPDAEEEEAELWQGSPFPGLRAFGAYDAPIFFGRGLETDELVARLSNKETRFLAVVGASGSGKSSLVGAGLIPRLYDNAVEGSKDWAIVCFTPDELGAGDPFASLASALRNDPLSIEQSGLAKKLAADPKALAEISLRSLPTSKPWAEILFFIDQFEELFTRVTPKEREAFIDMLVHTVQSDRVRVVTTLRADFYNRCIEIPAMAKLVKDNTYPLAAPTRDALREMIERPAARAGLTFEPGLVKRILDDTGDAPGALALMAFALQQLYDHRENGKLTFAAYQSFLGVKGAIGGQAQKAYDALDKEAQAALPTVFRKLVTVDSRGVPTRQRVDLMEAAPDEAALRLVAEFTMRRLLVQSRGESGNPVVEVAHEALFQSWPTLADWIVRTAEELRVGSDLLKKAFTWARQHEDPSYLLRGSQLDGALEWLGRAETLHLVDRLQREYIEASRDERQQRVEAERKQQEREIQLAQEAAEAERRRSAQLQTFVRLLIGAGVLLIGAVVLAVYFWAQSNSRLRQANEQADAIAVLIENAAASEQDAQALATAVSDYEAALAQGAEERPTEIPSPTPTNTPTLMPTHPPTPIPPSADEGRLIFTRGQFDSAEIMAVDPDGDNLVQLTDNDKQDSEPAWSPDGKQIVFVSKRDGSAAIYVMNADGSDVQQVSRTAQFDNHPDWSHDGTLIVYETARLFSGYNIVVMRADGSDLRFMTSTDRYANRAPVFSPDGTQIAFMTNRRGLWEIGILSYPEGELINLFSCPASDCRFPSWSPDGTQIAYNTLTADGEPDDIWVVDVATGESSPVVQDMNHNGRPSWSADGTVIYFNRTEVGSEALDVVQIDLDSEKITVISRDGYGPEWAIR